MSWSQQDLSFKKLSNKRVTTSTGKGLPEEKGASTLELYLPDIKTELIPGTGNTAYGLNGVLFYHGPTASFGQTLVVDTSVPGNLTWFATSGYGNTTTANDGSAGSESQRLFNWVSDKYDAFGTVSGAGYEIKLYDGSNNLITKSDASNWLFDYQTGILMFNNTQLSSGSAVSTSGPYKIVGWRYVGQKGVIPAYYGGSGYTTYTKGDLLVGAGGTFIKLNVGTDNYILSADSTTDSGLKWVVNSGSGSGSGISVLNGLSATTQYFAVGTSGSLFNISSSGSTHTFNIPIAGSGATGLVSTGSQTFAGQKTFTSAILADLTGTATTAGYASTSANSQSILNNSTSQNTDITVALISGTAISYNNALIFNPSTGRLAATTYTGSWAGSTITGFYGGTGYTTYTKGDILVGSGGTFIKLGVGSDTYVLTASSTSATGLTWSPTAATGITTLNSLTATQQYFSTGTSGSTFNISSSGSTHTFNIPIAGTGATGLVSTLAQTFAGAKTFTGDVVITSSTASTYMANGALTVNGGVGISGQLSVNQVAMGYTGIATNPVMAFIGSTNTAPITMSVLSDGSLLWEGSSGKLFGINNNLSSGWIFNVGDISGLPILRANADGTIAMAEFAASVGIGISNPSYKLHVVGDTNLSSGYVYRINGTSVLSSTQVLGLTVNSGNITSGAWSGTAISVPYGGTGLTSYTVGDILYASGSATIGRLTAGTAGSVLISAGAGATPYYSSPALLVSGNATTAANINIVSATTGTFYPLFSNTSTTTSGVAVSVDSGISFDSATDTLTAGKFSGLHSGSAATFTNIYGTLTGFATTATNVNSVSTTGTNASHYLLFSPANGGSGVALSSGVGITFNPSTGQLGLGTGSALINGLLLGTSSNTITTTSGNLTLNAGGGTVLVAGNLNVQGTATYIDSTTETITDPVIVLGSGAGGTHTNVTDTQDRGIEYRRYSGSAITGFFGYSNASGRFTFIPNANVTANNTYAGSVGVIEANITGTAITATNLYGALVGNAASATTAGLATTAQNVNIVSATTGTFYPLFSNVSTTTSGVALSVDSGISWNAATDTLTAGTFSGNLSATAATATNFYGTFVGSATTSTSLNVVLAGTNASHPILFTPTSGSASGVAVSTESSFVYNPSTDILSVSGLAVTSSTASTNSSTGALIVTGGVGIGQSVNISGRVGIGTNLLNAALNIQVPSTTTSGIILKGNGSQTSDAVTYYSSTGSTNFAVDANGRVRLTGMDGIWNTKVQQNIFDVSDGRINWNLTTWQYSNIFWYTANAYFQQAAGQLQFTNSGTTSVTGIGVLATGWDTGGANRVFGIVSPSGSERTYFKGYGNLVINPNNPNALHTAWNTMDLITLDISGTATTYSGNIILGKVEGTERFSVGPFGNTKITVGSATTATGLIVKAVASQSGNIIETQASSGATNFYVSPTGGGSFSDNLEIRSAKEVRFNNSGNTFYTGFKAGANASNTTYTLPIAFPGSGTSVLQSDTSGTLSWVGVVGSAVTAQNLNIVAANTNSAHQLVFTPTSGSGSGVAVSSRTTLNFNPSTDILSVSGLAVTASTASTNSSTGALIVTGGVGIGGTIYTATDLNVGTSTTGRLYFSQATLGSAGTTVIPSMAFIGTTNSPITLSVLADNSLSFDGSSGQLFSINNNLSTGWIFAVNDISGLPLIRANADGTVAMGEFAGNIGIGLSNPSYKLHVVGDTNLSSGYVYRINGNSVLSATSLGTGVTNSSLTAVGTISTGTWAGSTITARYGGTGYTNYTKGDLLVGNGSTFIKFGVGSDNQILIASSYAGSGLSWANFSNPTYGSFYSTSTQPVAGSGVSTFVTFNGTYEANRVAILGGAGTSSRIQIQDSGPFSLTFSAQINLLSGTQPKVGDMWFRINGVDQPLSNTEMTITGKDYQTVLTVNFVYTFQANDYVEIMMSSSDANFSLESKTSLTSPPRPDIPSIILSVLPVTHVIGSSGTATSGIQFLNGLVTPSQYFVTGTGGTDFNISSASNTHTFNIPDASTANRGLITTGSQTLLGSKTFASGVAITASLGSTSTSTGALIVSGGVGIGGSLYTSSSYADSISGVVLNNGVITSGSWAGSTITGLYGGTGYTSYTKGDLLVGAGNTFVKLSTGTDGYVLGANSNLPSGLGWTTVSGVAISTAPPAAPKNADLWFNSTDGSLSVYYQDVDTSQWVEIALGSGVDLTNDVHITSTTGSTSVSTGALIVDGGVGIAGTANIQSVVINGLYDQIGTTLTTSATTINQVALTLNTSTYRSAKLFVQASSGSTYHAQEIMMMHDGSNVYMTEYSMVNSGAIGSTFDGDISGGNMRFLVTPTYAVTTYKIACSAMRI